MSNHRWQAANDGVLLWEPAREAAIVPREEEQRQLDEQDHASSHDCIEEEKILPLIEDVFISPRIEPEASQNSLMLESSSSSSSFSEIQSLTPIATSRYSLPADSKILSENCRSDRDATANSPRRVRRKLDFKMKTPSLHTTSTPQSDDSRRVRQRASNTGSSTRTPLSNELSNIESLENLRNLERPQLHLWDEDERALLTILYRWYDSTDIWIIPQVFNKITGLNLQLRSIRHQFTNHLLLYGGRAYPEFARVMTVPFHDPEGRYEDIHWIIEEAIADLGVELPRREIEEIFKSGMARKAKSPRTRQTYKSLVRRAVEREREKARLARMNHCVRLTSSQPPLTIPKKLLGHKVLVLGAKDEAEECWVDTEDLSSLTSPTLAKRTIAFRVWDSESRTNFSEETGFTSQAFTIWRGEYPPPFSPEGQGQQALMVLTNLHLCLKGGASTFVSLSTSLLQALVKASAMKNPSIAVVALDNPLLTAPNKTLPAADILHMLKAEGQAWWARYKGHAERMVWASVPASTILSHFPISDLCNLAEQDETCAQILNLDAFHRGRKTRHVSNAMRAKQNLLTPSTAKAMGAIARTFGMQSQKVSLAHIQGLVAALVDSFQIIREMDHLAHNHDDEHDDYEEDFSYAFARELRSRAHSIKEVAQAFREGVTQGREIIAYYARWRWCKDGREGLAG